MSASLWHFFLAYPDCDLIRKNLGNNMGEYPQTSSMNGQKRFGISLAHLMIIPVLLVRPKRRDAVNTGGDQSGAHVDQPIF